MTQSWAQSLKDGVDRVRNGLTDPSALLPITARGVRFLSIGARVVVRHSLDRFSIRHLGILAPISAALAADMVRTVCTVTPSTCAVLPMTAR